MRTPMQRTGIACRLAFAFICALACLPASAQDAKRGQALYELNCLTCHYERIHKRDPARSLVRTQAQLRNEVVNRAALTKQRFTIEDLDDIAEYLDLTHYRFQNTGDVSAPATSAPSQGK